MYAKADADVQFHLAIRPHLGGAAQAFKAYEPIVALLKRLGYAPPV